MTNHDSRPLRFGPHDVFPLALGCMGMSGMYGASDEDESVATIHAAIDRGVNLLDTGDFYGTGHNELLLGRALRGRRDRVLLSVKFGALRGPDGSFLGQDCRPAAIKNSLAHTLTRLGTDHVDLWQVHGFDPAVPFEETCTALRTAVDSGRTRYLGVSGVSGWQLATLAGPLQAAVPGSALVSVEAEYSLLERAPEQSVLPAAAVHGAGLLAWAALGRGVLTGKYRHGTPADSRGASPQFTRYVGRYRTERSARIVEAVVTAADGLGTSPLAVACAWVRDRTGVASVVIGARDRAQLLGSLAAEEITLPAEIRSALDDVSAGSGEPQ